jgi:hypothetical protein
MGKSSTKNGKAGKGKGKNANLDKVNREKAEKRSAAIALARDAEVAPQERLHSHPLEAHTTRSIRNVPALIDKWEKSNGHLIQQTYSDMTLIGRL